MKLLWLCKLDFKFGCNITNQRVFVNIFPGYFRENLFPGILFREKFTGGLVTSKRHYCQPKNGLDNVVGIAYIYYKPCLIFIINTNDQLKFDNQKLGLIELFSIRVKKKNANAAKLAKPPSRCIF